VGHRQGRRVVLAAEGGGHALGVGVVGYTLGGGPSRLAREHGFACDSATAIELVTADRIFGTLDALRAIKARVMAATSSPPTTR
jgi:hypothetical protein